MAIDQRGELWYVPPKLAVIPDDGTYLVFSPLSGSAARVNAGAVAILQYVNQHQTVPSVSGLDGVIESLRRSGFISRTQMRLPEAKPPRLPYWSDSVTIFPSTDCNLRCKYCYSEGGEQPVYSNERIMTAAVDFAFKGAIAHPLADGRTTVSVGFHGGGEPLHNKTLPLVQGIVAYAQRRAAAEGLALKLSVATNGVLPESTRGWMIETFDSIQVSLDGPEHIQNLQRPTAGGGPSYPAVMRTIDALEQSKKPYSIRSTVSAYSNEFLPDIVRFLSDMSSMKCFHLEPLFECGRCRTAEGESPESRNPTAERFISQYLAASDIATGRGIELYCTGALAKGFKQRFCGAAGDNFVVTPEGDATTCFEVCRKSDPRSSTFFTGRYDEAKEGFVFDNDRIANLARRTADRIPGCSSCWTQYSCAGDCLAKVASTTNDIYDTSKNPHCQITTRLGKEMLSRRLVSITDNKLTKIDVSQRR